LPLSELTSWRIEQWKSKLRASHKPGTVNVYLAVLKNILYRAVEWNLLKSNPAVGVKGLKLGDQRSRYLTLDELNRLLEAVEPTPWLHCYTVLALHTGLRWSDMSRLSWSQNVDLEHGQLVIRLKKTQRVKTIPLNAAARKAIEALQALPVIDDRLFPVSYSTFYQAFKTAVHSAGIKDFTGHDLRHSFASHLLMAGSDLATVSRLMGHANLNMTMRYAHLSQRHEADAVAKLDAKLAQNRNVFDGDPTEVVEIPSKQVANAVLIT
jgi:integrase